MRPGTFGARQPAFRVDPSKCVSVNLSPGTILVTASPKWSIARSMTISKVRIAPDLGGSWRGNLGGSR
jgi:hypothetical protein